MRKEMIFDIEDNGNVLRFKIRQMPATKQQKFLLRLLLLATKSGIATGIDISDGAKLSELNAKDISVTSVLEKIGNVDYDAVEPLIAELLGCCSRIVDGAEMPCTLSTVDGYVDEVKTVFKLEMEAAKLNFSFLQGGKASPVSEAKADITISKRTKI